jgi:hypothetical protein
MTILEAKNILKNKGYKVTERVVVPAGIIAVENDKGQEIKNFPVNDTKNVDASTKFLARHGGKMVSESKLHVVDEMGKPVNVDPNDPIAIATFLRKGKGRQVVAESRIKESFEDLDIELAKIEAATDELENITTPDPELQEALNIFVGSVGEALANLYRSMH